MKNELFGKTLAECKGYQFTAVKQNTNEKGEHNKFITLNSQPGNRETAVNIYLSKNLSRQIELGQYVPPTALIREMVDEETGETWPLLTSNSSYVSLDELLAMFE